MHKRIKQYQNSGTIDELTASIADNPSDYELYLKRGFVYLKQDNSKAAEIDFKRAKEISPGNDAFVHYGYIRALTLNRCYSEALTECNSAIAQYPNVSLLYSMRGSFYVAEGRKQEAEEDYTQAISLDPTNSYVLGNRAYLYLTKNKFQEAERDITEAIALEGDDPYNYNMYNYIYIADCYSQGVERPTHTIPTIANNRETPPSFAPRKDSVLESMANRLLTNATDIHNKSAIWGGVIGVGMVVGMGAWAIPLAVVGGVVYVTTSPVIMNKMSKICLHSKERKQWNDSHIAETAARTIPDILAAIPVYDEKCGDEHKKAWRDSCHELYSRPGNRAIMEIIGWAATCDSPRLVIQVIAGNDLKSVGHPNAAGWAYGSRKLVQVCIDPLRKSDNSGIIIHEFCHIAVEMVVNNSSKAYDKLFKKRYKALIQESESREVQALTVKEQIIIRKMLEPYTSPIYNPDKSWKAERIARLPELSTLLGEQHTISRLYPKEMQNFYGFQQQCQLFLRGRHAFYKEIPAQNHISEREDSVNLYTIAQSIFWRAEYAKWGTLRKAIDPETQRNQLERILKILVAEGVTNMQVMELYQQDKKHLEAFCSQCAEGYLPAFERQKSIIGRMRGKDEFIFFPERVADNSLQQSIQRAVNMLPAQENRVDSFFQPETKEIQYVIDSNSVGAKKKWVQKIGTTELTLSKDSHVL